MDSESASEYELQEYQRWRRANVGDSFGLLDFAHGYLSTNGVSLDCVWLVLSVVAPIFLECRGALFLQLQFCKKKADRMFFEGKSPREVESWCNLVCLDELFLGLPDASWERVEMIARLVRDSWNQKLKNDYPDRQYLAEVDVDRQQGDIPVSFCRESSASP